ELQGDVTDTLAAGAGQGAEALDGAQFLFQDVGDCGLDHLRVRPWQHRTDRNDGRVHIGKLADGKLGVTNDPEQHQREAEHAGENGPPNGEVGNLHESVRVTGLDTEVLTGLLRAEVVDINW